MSNNYIMKLSETVEREHIRYTNRFGLAIAADLYKAKNLDLSQMHPAIIVGAPYGGVKEQGPCVYADEFAKRGFVVLTFDQSFMGEDAEHIDLYDRADRIPFDKLTNFFQNHLRNQTK